MRWPAADRHVHRKPVAEPRELEEFGFVTLLSAEIGAADGFVITMLGVIALAMGTIALLFFCMKRAAAKRDPYVDALLEELEREEREAERLARTKHSSPPTHPWERDADWWKK